MSKSSIRVLVVAVVLIGVALSAWLVLRDDDSTSSSAGETVTQEELREQASERGVPIYWAGPQGDAELELSQPDESRTYVRYLTDGAPPGDPRPDFLTVGTYAFPDAAGAVDRQSRNPGAVRHTAPGGGIVFFNRDRPQSVYLAYPDVDVQIEVYSPDADRALGLVTSGQIVPVR